MTPFTAAYLRLRRLSRERHDATARWMRKWAVTL